MNKFFASAAIALLLLPQTGHAGWIKSSLEPSCSDYSRSRVAAGTRRQIEFSVRRAEASIRPPEPVGKLSCLESLMDTRIDQFAPTGNLNSIFFESLDGFVDLPGQVARRICSLAQRSWNEVTRPLEQFGFDSGDAIPPDYISRFDLVNFPGQTDSRASAGIFRRNGQEYGEASGFDSNTANAFSGTSDLNGNNSLYGRGPGYGSNNGKIRFPDETGAGEADAESLLINEIWKSLYGG